MPRAPVKRLDRFGVGLSVRTLDLGLNRSSESVVSCLFRFQLLEGSVLMKEEGGGVKQ